MLQYNEIDHDSWLIEIGVLSTQILAPALFILPLAFALCYWTGLEGYYFWDLPITDSMDGFSKFYLELDNQSPGRVGRWIGWQIVKSFMNQNPKTSAQELLSMPFQKLFYLSKYKPKR